MLKKKRIRFILLILVLIGGGYCWYQYNEFMRPPSTRLATGRHYNEMPPDQQHFYIELPIDHNNPSIGNFTGFYILSPHFKPGNDVVFQLYDNQQEKVGLLTKESDFSTFNETVGNNTSYVLIGNRGVDPTFFPEVYDSNGNTNFKAAIKLYSSEQQIDDIEFVRQDMVKRGLLTGNGKIMLIGGSGGGFLVQQYLNKYGDHVSRALIASTSAPDICKKNNLTFSRSFYNSNPIAAIIYFDLDKKGKASPSLAWLLFKTGLDGNTDLQIKILNGESKLLNISAFKERLEIPNNWAIINFIFHSPKILEVKVRIWELLGGDLVKYQPVKKEDINLMYETMTILLDDFIKSYKKGIIPVVNFDLNRSLYKGEVLVCANSGDQDFGTQAANLISQSYTDSRLIIFNEKSHRLNVSSKNYKTVVEAFFNRGLHSKEMKQVFDQATSNAMEVK